MEGSHHSSPASDRPFLPHDDPQHPISRAESSSRAELALNFPSRRVSFGPVNPEHEADIADSRSRLVEKGEPTMPTRRPGGDASLKEEAQALDWIVPVQNGAPLEEHVRVLSKFTYVHIKNSYLPAHRRGKTRVYFSCR